MFNPYQLAITSSRNEPNGDPVIPGAFWSSHSAIDI